MCRSFLPPEPGNPPLPQVLFAPRLPMSNERRERGRSSRSATPAVTRGELVRNGGTSLRPAAVSVASRRTLRSAIFLPKMILVDMANPAKWVMTVFFAADCFPGEHVLASPEVLVRAWGGHGAALGAATEARSWLPNGRRD
jgi:hypothetical protein